MLKDKLSSLLALLRAAQQTHWTIHWQSQGLAFYSDHQLFDRLYTGMSEEIDGLAEKIVRYYGEEAVDPLAQMQGMTNWVQKWTQNEDTLVDMADAIEFDIQQSIEEALETAELTGEASYGLENFLQGIADSHETNQYLLGQRMKVAKRYIIQCMKE